MSTKTVASTESSAVESTDVAQIPTTQKPLHVVPEMMRAMVFADYGEPSVLHEKQVKTPTRRPGQVLIQVVASSVNPIDYRLRRGEMKGLLPGGFPRIPGYDVAGFIADVADDAPLSVGQPVIAFLDSLYGGASAEYAVCAIDSVAVLPEPIPVLEAAAMPLAGTTALQSLRDHGKIMAGDRVLINGASGGVGIFAIQIAKAFDCHVTAVASGKNRETCMSLGADEFIDYEQSDFTELNRTWDLIFDAAGKASYLDARRVMSDECRFVSTEPDVKGMVLTAVTAPLSKKAKVMLAKPNTADLMKLVGLYREGKLRVELDSVFPLEDLADAHRRVESGVDHGKVVIEVD
ncbi:NAD(P)-dependent alcohol dehydrogenase [Stieleria sp. JC731]|uniref:NAD(P)-dependent alcohol dehydrogenase n=1 Tax=Pirellulaceae TaxID=2691357 RepID=UPI001E42F00A|nr:NAD(P)-dependent alcohol dehydrogenase [Stieleria sp. JC731]MCC9600750.1 NAD(P)-dependent alcohol dehydrogenase [Stieleria sp. JC731]